MRVRENRTREREREREKTSPVATLAPIDGSPTDTRGVDAKGSLGHRRLVRFHNLGCDAETVLSLVVLDQAEVLHG